MKKIFFVVQSFFAMAGCQSNVDKCVADWERANPNEGEYCASYERSIVDGKCREGTSQTRAQALAFTRMQCMRAAKGE